MAKPKAAPAAKAKRVQRIPVFRLRLGPELRMTYILLIHSIYVEIARRLREENDDLPKPYRFPMRVAGKLFTPADGIFLVEIIPEDPEEGVLTLLFRFKDLYFESYHFDGVWYRLSDHAADLPPNNMIPYTRVVILTGITTSYASLGGYCPIGRPAFLRCYAILSSTGILLTTRQGLALLRSGPLCLPANGISEAVRFRMLEKWVKVTLRGECDRQIPGDISMYFTDWGDSSSAMYTKKVPSSCVLTMGQLHKRMGVLKRMDMVEVTKLECSAKKPQAFVLGWHQEDRKRMLQASLNVSSLDRTLSYYTNCFTLKLLRKEAAAEGLQTRAIVGFDPEVKSFVLHLEEQENRVQHQDKHQSCKPMGFGHIAIAHPDVQSLVDTIIVNGGKVTGYAAKDGPSVSASAEDPDGYRFKLLQRGPTPERICQLMLHVTDIGRAIKFYEMALGMKLLTQNRVVKDQGWTSMARMGYDDEHMVTVLELTCKHGVREYSKENGYKQVTIGTNDVQRTGDAVKYTIEQMGGQILEGPGMLPISKVEMISFVDPEGWKVVLVDKKDFLTERP